VAGDNFAPLGSQVTNLPEFLGCQLARGHEQSLHGLTPNGAGALILLFDDKVLQRAKPVRDSQRQDAAYQDHLAAVALLRRQQGRIRERLLHFCSLASKSDTHLLPLFESGKRCVSLFAF
jgi:hypothetical protein